MTDSQQLFRWACRVSDGWKSRWVESKHKSDYGQWKLSAGKFYGDAEAEKGMCFSHSDVHANVSKDICVDMTCHAVQQPQRQRIGTCNIFSDYIT